MRGIRRNSLTEFADHVAKKTLRFFQLLTGFAAVPLVVPFTEVEGSCAAGAEERAQRRHHCCFARVRGSAKNDGVVVVGDKKPGEHLTGHVHRLSVTSRCRRGRAEW